MRLIDAGDRIYLDGKTFGHKDMIKERGGQWDEAERKWFFPAEMRDVAVDIARSIPDPVSPNTPIYGSATYNGRTYGVLWEHVSEDRVSYKLALRDGSDSFWADGNCNSVSY